MEMRRYSAVPPISASAAEIDRNEDSELQKEMEQCGQRISSLKDKENYEDPVSNINRFYIFFFHSACVQC